MDNNLRDVLNRQKEVLAELEAEVRSIENSDLTKENARLRAELEKLNAARLKSEQNAKELSGQNASLKNALHEQLYSEKLKIAGASEKKLDIYFKENFGGAENRLILLENGVKSRINDMTAVLLRNGVDIKDEIYVKLEELSARVNLRVTEARRQFAQSRGAFSENERAEFDKLREERISDEQIAAAAKKNNLERFVGLNLLNIIGIILIIIGVITAARYTYVKLPDALKGVMMFALGAAMLGAGELMNRRKPNIFSLGITAGGAGVLYAALAASYFGLKILGMYPALALCVLITAAAFFLSTRYNSRTILAIALVGGYLPIFSIGADRAMIYGAMVYFVALNLLALIVSFKKRWSLPSFVGLGLNIAGTVYICNFSVFYMADKVSMSGKVVTVLYILFAFLNYSLIPIVSAFMSKLRFRRRDVALLAVNTFFSSLIMYAAFYGFRWQGLTGALAVAFAAIYLSLGWLIEKKFDGEKHTQALFYLTGLAFVVLIIPFQFGKGWLTLGWLAEGAALAAYGILKDEKSFRRAGFAISALCLWAFLFFDVALRIDGLFAYKYAALTLGSLVILGAYIYKRTLSSAWQRLYKCGVIVNLWFYALYLCYWHIYGLMPSAYSAAYLTAALAIFLTFSLACAAPRIRILSDMSVKAISIALYIIGIIGLFVLNGSENVYFIKGAAASEIITGSVVLALISLLSVLALRDLIKLIVMERGLGVEWYPLIVSAYFVIILTQNLIAQYGLSFASAWISVIYVLTALAWIIFGFVRRYSFIRRFGLGLSLLAVVKLFIIDLGSLTRGYQIVTYFALGITLVAISFVYQYFNKRLELKTEVPDNASEDN